MKILLTNDDGYKAPGIQLLKQKLAKYGEVYIVAPATVMSGKSTSITIGECVSVTEIEPHVFALGGTPADCVSFGLSMLDVDFDLVVSGCNMGLNISSDVIHSGTCGACFNAMTYRKKNIAFSCDCDLEVVDQYFDQIMQLVLDKNILSEEVCWNVNFPKGKIEGIAFTKLYYRHEKTYFEKRNEGYYALRDIAQEDYPKDSDCYAAEHGIISLTPLLRVPHYDGLLKHTAKK